MKRNLFLLFVLTSWLVSAQYHVETHDGDPIVDGQTVTYGTYGYENGASLDFYVYNDAAEQIFMKIEFVSASNNDGSQFELCFGLCYTGLTIGWSYPPGSEVVAIEPGEHQTSSGDHFLNLSDGGGNAIDYVFRFYQVDANGDEIGEDLTLTYRYDPNLGIGEENRVNARIASTVVNDQIVIEAMEATQINIFDVQGRKVVSEKVTAGISDVNIAGLPAQVYLVQLVSETGANETIKIVKR